MTGSRRDGSQFEQQAKNYLVEQGLQLLQQNYRCRFGEIDLIMRDHETICFIEVKYRNSLSFGGSAYALPASKQRKITRSAQTYLAQHNVLANHPLRFDAFLIQGQTDGSQDINWIKSAFYAV